VYLRRSGLRFLPFMIVFLQTILDLLGVRILVLQKIKKLYMALRDRFIYYWVLIISLHLINLSKMDGTL
jgi:hypothetical protein